MFNFIKNLFRSEKQEPTATDTAQEIKINLDLASSARYYKAAPFEREADKPKAKRKPSNKPRKPSAKMSAKTSYNESTSPNVGQNTSGDFATSMIVAQATDNAALGILVGGDPMGAIVGASMAHHNETHHIQHTDYSADSAISTESTTHYNDHTPSYDSSPSYDNSSYSDSTSYDSSSSGGGDW
jgi:hypothetical protein